MKATYLELPENEKEYDRKEADQILTIVNSYSDSQKKIEGLRDALKMAHGCATLRVDGTCDGCFVSAALAETERE